jgi:hypothetical protein
MIAPKRPKPAGFARIPRRTHTQSLFFQEAGEKVADFAIVINN